MPSSLSVVDIDYDNSIPDPDSLTNSAASTTSSDITNDSQYIAATVNHQSSYKNDSLWNWLPIPAPLGYPSVTYVPNRVVGGGDISPVIHGSPVVAHSLPSISDIEPGDGELQPFIEEMWIGCGKWWVDPMPLEVCMARNDARYIPPYRFDNSNSQPSPDRRGDVIPTIGDPQSIEFQHILRQRRPDLLASLVHISSLRNGFEDR